MDIKVAYIVTKIEGGVETLSIRHENTLRRAIERVIPGAKAVTFSDKRVHFHRHCHPKVVNTDARVCTITLGNTRRISEITARGIVSVLRHLPPRVAMEHIPSYADMH